jgi:hypothetical protein
MVRGQAYPELSSGEGEPFQKYGGDFPLTVPVDRDEDSQFAG